MGPRPFTPACITWVSHIYKQLDKDIKSLLDKSGSHPKFNLPCPDLIFSVNPQLVIYVLNMANHKIDDQKMMMMMMMIQL